MSVFDLPQQPDIRHDNINARYVRVEPLSGFQSDRFSSTQLNYQFNTSSSVFWDPSKSYFRIRANVLKADGKALTLSDNIAPSQYFAANLFSSIEYQLGGQTVSRCPQDVALAEAFFSRTSKSGSWMDKVGQSTLLSGSFKDRQNMVCSDGRPDLSGGQPRSWGAITDLAFVVSSGIMTSEIAPTVPLKVGDRLLIFPVTIAGGDVKDVGVSNFTISIVEVLTTRTFGVTTATGTAWTATTAKLIIYPATKIQSASHFETCYQANSLSVMNLPHGIPGGSHRFSLTPNSQYLIDCVESPGQVKTSGVDYKVEIEEVVFFAYLVQSPIHFDDVKYSLNTSDVQIQRLDVPSSQGSSVTKIFSIAANTRTIAVGFQGRDQKTFNQKTKLVINDLTVPAVPKFHSERELSRLFIQYRGKQWPSPDSDVSMNQVVDSSSRNFITKMYFDTMVSNGLFPSAGGCEDIDTFMSNGFYYLFEVAGDTTDNSTSLVVNFSGITSACDVIVFAVSDSSRIVAGKDGRIVAIETSSTLGQIGSTQGGSGTRYHY